MVYVKSRRTYAKKGAALLPALLAAFALACGSLVSCGGDDGNDDTPPPNVVPDFTGTEITGKTLKDALAQIDADTAITGNYRITLGADEKSIENFLSYTAGRTVSIILRSDAVKRTVTLNEDRALFTVGANVTLTLENITLKGRGLSIDSYYSLVRVDGGTLIMKNDSAITENKSSGGGGGVEVGNGTFTMDGGAISGNATTASSGGGGVYVISSGTFTMNGGAISGNSASRTSSGASNGGGVYVGSGTFTMNGGTISGNSASKNSSKGGGVYISSNGIFKKTATGGIIYGNDSTVEASLQNVTSQSDYGHAVYFDALLSKKYRDTTVKAGDTLSTAATLSGSGWDQ